MPARIDPAKPPYSPEIQDTLARIMPPGIPPLTLFTTLVRDSRLFERFRRGAGPESANCSSWWISSPSATPWSTPSPVA